MSFRSAEKEGVRLSDFAGNVYYRVKNDVIDVNFYVFWEREKNSV